MYDQNKSALLVNSDVTSPNKNSSNSLVQYMNQNELKQLNNITNYIGNTLDLIISNCDKCLVERVVGAFGKYRCSTSYA